AVIRTRGLSRTFSQKNRQGGLVNAVRGIDLDVREGEIFGFLGPNGAGKTTTLRMLTTLLRPTAGEAVVAGCDLTRDTAGVRRRIGYVAQSNGTSPESTVVEELVIQCRLYGLTHAQAHHRSAELMDQLDLGDLRQRRTRTLSGGQRRRLDVALGLIHRPPLVFLDEPTTGLDPQSRANLWDHVRMLHRAQGVTIFLTTHYMDEVDALADRIVIIDDGSIVAEGSPDFLKSKVAGDGVTVGVPEGSVWAAAERVSRLPGAHAVTARDGLIRFRVPHGSVALPSLTHALHEIGVAVTSLNVQRPTLDDVFFTLTGRSLRESSAAAPAGSSPHEDRNSAA
ncbi:ATP-binding cassette domain-containing protein, partial [Streptomyces sp. NPDC020951]|uniref:ATP-binding cassette domain-containing protein n=1 Tax=Streptomyces sp. NPDC020951 TaxID=3365104 RepID=UPI00378A6EAC